MFATLVLPQRPSVTSVVMSTQQGNDGRPTSRGSIEGDGEDRRPGESPRAKMASTAVDTGPDMRDFGDDNEMATAESGHDNVQDFTSVGDMFSDPAAQTSSSSAEDGYAWPESSSAPGTEGEIVVRMGVDC